MNNPSPTNVPDLPCDLQRLDQFLNSDHYRLEDDELILHLDSCVECREYLDNKAASTSVWENLSTLLQPSEFDEAGAADFSAATIAHVGQKPVAAQDVIDALSPTDDPHRLGRLGTYEVTGVVGVGGMGVVLKAVDPSLDRVVAIKVMAPHLANNQKARKRFEREAKAAAAVIHPNVISIHGVASGTSLPYLVMSYIRGGSLQKRLDQDGPPAIVEVLRIGSQIAQGLAAAHQQGLVHRDIKPENVLLEEGVERVTITDFGLARAVDDNTLTQHGTIAGTPMYMSPEQARGEQVDQTSDLFSLGSVLYALCTGRPPFRAETSFSVMRRIIDEKPTPVSELNPDVPEWLALIVEKLMAKEKAERFASADEVHKLLEACLNHVQQPEVVSVPDEVTVIRRPQMPAHSGNEPQRDAARTGSGAGFGKWIALGLAVCLVGGVFGLLAYLQDAREQRVKDAYANLRQYLQTGKSDEMSLNSLNVLLSNSDGHEYLRKLDRESDRIAFAEGGLPQGLEVAAALLHDDRVTPKQTELSFQTWREGFSGGSSAGSPKQLRIDSIQFHSGGLHERKVSIGFTASTEEQDRKEVEEFFKLTPGAEYVLEVSLADVIQDRVDWIDVWKDGKPIGVLSATKRQRPRFSDPERQAESDRSLAIAEIKTIQISLNTHKLIAGDYPSKKEGLKALLHRADGNEDTPGRDPQNFKDVLLDPWGNPYGYQNPGAHGNQPDIWSTQIGAATRRSTLMSGH